MSKDKKLFYFPISFKESEVGSGNAYWKQILKYGEVSHPLDLSIKHDINERMVDNVVDAFSKNVLEKVPILSGTHDNDAVEKTVGLVQDLRKTTDGLDGKMEILDEDISKLVETKDSEGKSLLSGVSVYIAPSGTSEGDFYPEVLWHVALTNFPWITGMDDFVKIAASHSVYTIPRLVKFENLSQRVEDIRSAYYSKIDRNLIDYSYVKEVHDEFVIVSSDESGLLRYSYVIDNDGDITFGDSERVRAEYVALANKEIVMGDQDKNKKDEGKVEEVEKFFTSIGLTNGDFLSLPR